MDENRPEKKPMNPKLRAFGRAVWTGTKIVLKSLLLLPIPVFMVLFNIDVAATMSEPWRENPSEYANATALLSGEALEKFDQLNERLILKELIQNLEEPFDTVALGSSRILQLTEGLSGSDSFYNCGLSGADYRDIMNVFYLFDKADKLPENLIIGLDPWLLNSDPNKLHRFSDGVLFEEFLTVKLGYDTGYTPAPEQGEDPAKLLSPVVFRDNLEFTLNDDAETVQAQTAGGDWYDQPSQLKLPDGTTLYPREWREKSQEDVTNQAMLEMQTFLNMDDFIEPSEELCLLFHQFITYVQSRNVNVIFVLMPYHPIVYTYATEHAEKYPGFFLTEPWYTRYARAYGIPLYGSYNPFATESGEDEFYDGLHVKGEVIPSIFPGVATVLKAQASGSPYSPWVAGGPRVSGDEALRIVRQRQEIPDEQPTRLAADVVIKGELCYQVERYSHDGEDATLLANYAVSRREGVLWRYDTEWEQWLQEIRFPG